MDSSIYDNKLLVENIVRKHFGLDEFSLQKFQKALFDPLIDETYLNVGLDENLRFRVSIPIESYSLFDKGWKLFSKFNRFIKENKISYENFRQNKYFDGKNTRKIFKTIRDFYFQNEDYKKSIAVELDLFYLNNEDFDLNTESILSANLQSINNYRLPVRKRIYMVLSLNFADWFLSATSEDWSSCLNLNSSYSGCYWADVAGSIIDKNRALFYITNGDIKEYKYILSERMLCRSWVLLDKESNFNLVKFYPSKLFPVSGIRKITGLDFFDMEEGFISKHAIDFLYYKNNKTCFPFLDNSTFNRETRIVSGTSNDHGHFYFSKGSNNKFSGQFFHFSGGLNKIINEKKDLVRIDEEAKYICEDCESEILASEIITTSEGYHICRDCAESNYIRCDFCNDYVHYEESFRINGLSICGNCFQDNYTECSECGDFIYNDDIYYDTDQDIYLCNYCRQSLMEKTAI